VRDKTGLFALCIAAIIFAVSSAQGAVIMDFESLATGYDSAWLLVGTGIGIAILFHKLR
jgi:hypothetical protein